jgi:hypothetical protein
MNRNSFENPKYWSNVSNASLFVCFQYLILAVVLAVANAAPSNVLGYAATPLLAAAPPSITSQQSNILRSYGNLGQVSTYSKTIDTPYSSVRKSDVRVSNDALAYPAAPGLLPIAGQALVSPALAAPVGQSLLGVAYSAAPAVARMTYANGLGITYTY